MKTYNEDPEAVALLTPEQNRVTQEDRTERPFQNEYWDNKEPALFVDVVSGEPLFASFDKFDSATGWPSFTKPLEPANLVENADRSHGMTRTEVRVKHGDGHLGHLFPDGPRDNGGLRYVVTEVAPASDFWEAEPEHQDDLARIPNGYTRHFARPGWKLPRRNAA